MYVYDNTCIFASDSDFRKSQSTFDNEVEFVDRDYKLVYKKREKTLDVTKNGIHLYKTWCVLSHISGRTNGRAIDVPSIGTMFVRLNEDDYNDKLAYINSH